MRIGEVVAQLKASFPALSISKVRYLETEGLITPHRVGNGYRQYSPADVERLRFALTAQRDEYLPLSVIRSRLDELDQGQAAAPVARVVTSDGELVDTGPLDMEALTSLTGAAPEQIEELVAAGILVTDPSGAFPHASLRLTALALEASALGLPIRNLRTVRSAVRRQAAEIEQAVRHTNARSASAGEDASARLARTLSDLHEHLLHRMVNASR